MARPSPHALPVAEASRRLRELQVNHEVIGLQIKCGAINYWPTTATVRCDGHSREEGKGFDYFISVLRRQRVLK
jgi:hypothetical protein